MGLKRGILSNKKIFADNQREKESGRTRRLKEKEEDE